MIKGTILIFALVLLIRPLSRGDEGMWLPFAIEDTLYRKMQLMGLELTRDEIFSFDQSSLKDAIVHFGGGCTAGIISDQGLLITNHHCGYGRIQAHSTPENDILTDGFWAATREQELPNPGLFVNFLVKVEDVTDRIMGTLNDQMTWRERQAAISKESDQIVEEATQGNHYQANVRSKFAGNEFYLFVFERFTDVRMVGTPPSSIGKFGGDTDNWKWPRHTGDFMLFRVYTGPDGKPADFSPDNIPLKPRHYLPISLRGVNEGDFVMTLGYPGATERYITSKGIDFRIEYEYGPRINIRRRKLDIIEPAMAASDQIRIKYASRQASISNHWKKFTGMTEALNRHPVAEAKLAQEIRFTEWAQGDSARNVKYGGVMKMFEQGYEGLRRFHSHNYYVLEAFRRGPNLINVGTSYRVVAGMLEQDAPSEQTKLEIERLRRLLEIQYDNYDKKIDKQLWAAMMEVYSTGMPTHLQPEIIKEANRQFRGDFDKFAREVYRRSIFATRERLEKFLENPSAGRLRSDWVFRMAMALNDHNNRISGEMQKYTDLLDKASKLYIKGLREMHPERSFYPDANSTMRFTYGSVKGYRPVDAVYFDYYTTISGVMEKEDPQNHEFVVPQKLRQLYESGDFGYYSTEGVLPVNFISNTDITGGNSGSPVIDGAGNLIGLAFDGNWEALSGDIMFEPNMQRSINVDARYILFIIDKYAGARYLIDEMTIVK